MMYEMKSSVGKGQINYGGDVAFFQFAFMVIKGPGGRSVYSGPIDGLQIDLESWPYEQPRSLHANNVLKPNLLAHILKHVPAKYHRYRFHPFQSEGKWGLYVADATQSFAGYNEITLPLPKTEAESFKEIARRLRGRYGAFLSIKKLIVDSNGYFLANCKIEGGYQVDANTAEIRQPKQVDKGAYVRYLKTVPYSPLRAQNSQWELYDANSLTFKSKKAHPNLKINEAVQKRILERLGFKGSGEGAQVQSQAMAVYEKALILDELTPELEKKIFECFGTDAKSIRSNIKARREKCLGYLRTLHGLQGDLQEISSQAFALNQRIERMLAAVGVEATGGADAALARGVEREVLERYGSIAFDLVSAGFASKARSVTKGAKKLGLEIEQEFAKREKQAALATEVISVAKDQAQDNFDIGDAAITALGIVGIILSGPAGAIVGVIAVAASIQKAVSEIQDLKQLPKELQSIHKQLEILADNRLHVLEQIQPVIRQLDEAGCLKSGGSITAAIRDEKLFFDDGDVFVSYHARKAFLEGKDDFLN